MKPRKVKEHYEINDVQKMFDILSKESDFACVLIGTNFLDQALLSIIDSQLINSSVTKKLLDPSTGTLGNFSSRNDICYCLGLINKLTYMNLKKIGEIRNKFAHESEIMNFTNPEITKLINELVFPKFTGIKIDENGRSDITEPFAGFDHPRQRFTILLSILVNQLILINAEKRR